MWMQFWIKDKLSFEMASWSFHVNSSGYIDVYVERKLTDTLIDLGKQESYSEFKDNVIEQLKKWNVEWTVLCPLDKL